MHGMADASDRSQFARVPLRASVTPDTAEEIERYSTRYARFFDDIRSDLDELLTTGVMSRARELSATTRQHFNHNGYPHFFFGDLDASFVLVHLNPKQANNPAQRFEGHFPIGSFEEYFDAHRHFGVRTYGPSSPREHKSPFDHKQIRFLRPFDVVDFVEERKQPDDRFTNLERVIDRKLQLELIPYGSDSFSVVGFTKDKDILRPHYERIMDVIAARPRAYVIFCGAVFETMLDEYIVEEHEFRLSKNDGSPAQQVSRFANLCLRYGDRTIHAGLAHSWARQGIPMSSYAHEIRVRYTRGGTELPPG